MPSPAGPPGRRTSARPHYRSPYWQRVCRTRTFYPCKAGARASCPLTRSEWTKRARCPRSSLPAYRQGQMSRLKPAKGRGHSCPPCGWCARQADRNVRAPSCPSVLLHASALPLAQARKRLASAARCLTPPFYLRSTSVLPPAGRPRYYGGGTEVERRYPPGGTGATDARHGNRAVKQPAGALNRVVGS